MAKWIDKDCNYLLTNPIDLMINKIFDKINKNKNYQCFKWTRYSSEIKYAIFFKPSKGCLKFWIDQMHSWNAWRLFKVFYIRKGKKGFQKS